MTVITQSSPCPAPATADEPPDPLELLADVVDELETPPRDCTVTDEPPGMLVEPDNPPGPAVTVLDGAHSTTRQSLLALPSRLVLEITVELCDPLRPEEVVEELAPTAAHGSFACRFDSVAFGSAANPGTETLEITNATPNESARKDGKVGCFMIGCLLEQSSRQAGGLCASDQVLQLAAALLLEARRAIIALAAVLLGRFFLGRPVV